MFKKIISLSFATVSIAMHAQTQPQETVEQPIDTLTRFVTNMADELSKNNRLKITGYVQSQYQYADSAGTPSVAGGDFVNGTSKYYSRFMIRRGRFKFTYNYENVTLMVNTDATEKGLFMRETYVKITDPHLKMFSLITGLLQVQFGYELTQSSSDRETPERARYNQTLFPVERDLGSFASVVFPKSSPLFGLKADIAVMNGSSGVTPEFDSHKDFTGRLQYGRTTSNEKVAWAVAGSYYNGGYTVGTVKDYKYGTLPDGTGGFQFAADTGSFYRVAKRLYYGADAQVSIDWKPGITTLRAEFITGENPGTDKTNRTISALPTTAVYHRQFNGAYFYYIQNIGQSKFQTVVKYDWFDPNTKISGLDIGRAGSNTKLGDIRFDTWGFGVNYHLNHNCKITAYYDVVKNEKTQVAGYTNDIKDNVFTLRIQIRY